MLFSVLLCVNKDNPFLDEAINSILTQDYENPYEFIIVANNCSDELFVKLNNYKDVRIRLFRTAIGQLSFNLNYGVDKALGEYIVRMDADDVCYSNRLTILEKLINKSEADVIACSADIIDEYSEIVGTIDLDNDTNIVKQLIYKNPICHPAVALKKEALIKARGYLGGFQSEDLDLWLRLTRQPNTKFITSSEKVLKYRIHTEQSRGNILPYCEGASFYLREFLLTWKLRHLISLLISIFKRLIKPYK